MYYNAFIQLSDILEKYLNNQPTPYHELIQHSIKQAEIQNPWFIEKFVKTMLSHIQDITSNSSIEAYSANIQPTNSPKKVLVIAAGNIPMVSFRDVMDVLLSGHYLIFKPSSKDSVLMKMILHILMDLNPDIKNKVVIKENTITKNDINAVIATGTNNTAMHFQYYFSDKPKIIRNNRTSIAILDNSEADEELKKLADDILLYFGLGCRNVSKIFIPKNFDIQRIFKAVYDYGFVMQHHKYMNNYDYYRSIYLLNKEPFLENNFLIIKESEQLHAPVANLFYQYYSDISEVNSYISQHQNDIQTIIGKKYTPLGNAQFPSLSDFADGINTIEFLMEL
ncbi:MAG: acyl-CoA reductase [Bacteroidia bacterium]|nr:MAG: acyl-CoA reductase [Bacteroidia bacterium]